MQASDRQVAQLLGLLTTDLAGCGEADKLVALERALTDFCRRSRCWRETADVTIPEGSLQAEVVWPFDAIAIQARVVSVNGAMVGWRRVPLSLLPWGPGGRQGVLLSNMQESRGALSIVVFGILVPRRGEIDVPDWIIDRYGYAIADGAKAALKNHFRKPYTDPNGAAIAQRFFERGVADAVLDGVQRERGMAE